MPSRKSNSSVNGDNLEDVERTPPSDSTVQPAATLDGMISQLKIFTYYVGNNDIKNLFRWASVGMGVDMLVDDKTNQEAVLIIPMVVAIDKCTSDMWFSLLVLSNPNLKTANYRRPNQLELREVFQTEVELLVQCQKIAQMHNVHYLFGKNGQGKPEIIYFSLPVFEKKKHPLCREDIECHLSDFGNGSDNVPDIHTEDDVSDYLIPDEAHLAYYAICHDKQIQALPVYKDSCLVHPDEVKDILCGSLV
ncbi:hypothetical protein M422DRAFT_53439 [Sphaerobolus stellatus SS14]|uniref:Unplaced genomic scaffold SPHSTscaffold_170, whole genome shotgun sequence n=1 Tax=Sphaerobolus stellatus (strain SS14) TaxID=990650 RepID=A0A0C9V0W4_SPHS4|nr:hypothetical protein M422DRAFT_53439 [Sphaerobolus stellatus SS14]